jgi:hypothetical protein
MSVWQMPQYSISMTTSSDRGARRSMAKGATPEVGDWAA